MLLTSTIKKDFAFKKVFQHWLSGKFNNWILDEEKTNQKISILKTLNY